MKKTVIASIIFVLSMVVLSVSAQTTIVLKNGDLIQGEVTQKTNEGVTIQTSAGVLLKYSLAEVKSISGSELTVTDKSIVDGGWKSWFSVEMGTAIDLGIGIQNAQSKVPQFHENLQPLFSSEPLRVETPLKRMPPLALVKIFDG
jgi:hypothetical protein